MNRRESLKLMAVASLAAAIPGCTLDKVESAAATVDGFEDLSNRNPTQLSEQEFQTLSKLVNYIIPADERSGSASDAHVPQFIDFMMEDAPELGQPVRDALAWLDDASQNQFGAVFQSATTEQNHSLLQQIAYPDDVATGMEKGEEHFSMMRDLTASGFWSSKIGVEDLGYMGNTPQSVWNGCSDEAMDHIGMHYES